MKAMKKMLCFVMMVALTISMLIPTSAEGKKKAPKINKKKLTLTVGKSYKLKVKNNKKKVKWSTSKKKVATVKKGKVTAKKAGKATITAKVGKKKLTCKVTVKNKENAKDKTTPSSAVKLSKITILNHSKVQVTLSSAQLLTEKNFSVKYKNNARASYNTSLVVNSVSTTDKVNYILNLSDTGDFIYDNSYVQVTVSGLNGTGTASLETFYEKKYISTDNVVYTAMAGEQSIEFIYLYDSGVVITEKKLPAEIEVTMSSSRLDKRMKIAGTFAAKGTYTGKIVVENEIGDKTTYMLTWLVGDSQTLQATCMESYAVMEAEETKDIYSMLYVAGGSGKYNYNIAENDSVWIEGNENEASIYGMFSGVGTSDVTFEITDAENENIKTTCVWKVNRVAGKKVIFNVKDANGNEIKGNPQLDLMFWNQDDANKYELWPCIRIDEDKNYYAYFQEGESYDIDLMLCDVQKRICDVKITNSLNSIDVSLPVYPVKLKSDTVSLLGTEWKNEIGDIVGYGNTIYVSEGKNKCTGTLLALGKTYIINASFLFENKEITIEPSVKEISYTEIDMGNGYGSKSVTLGKDYTYFKVVIPYDGDYSFYSWYEGEGEASEDESLVINDQGVLFSSSLEWLQENDDNPYWEDDYNFRLEQYCSEGEVYYLGVKASDEDSIGKQVQVVVSSVGEE